MQKNEIWMDYKIDSGAYRRFIFNVNENQEGFKIFFDSTVQGNGLDLRFVLCTHGDGEKLIKWMNNRRKYQYDSKGQMMTNKQGYPVIVAVPPPQIEKFFDVRTNILKRTVNVPLGNYTLFFDNTYSTMTGKNLWLHIVETWDEEHSGEDLPIMQHLLEEMHPDVTMCINDANDCYVAGHYNQCSVMLRKAVDLAIKIKLLQSGMNTEQLLDKTGNEIGLSSKIKILKKKKLVTQKNSSGIEHVKWFGNIGAHGTMRVVEQDIRDNIDPKIRSFLVELNLKS